jgi:hypothetical protein
MQTTRLSIALAGILIAGWSTTPANAQTAKVDEAAKARDHKFDTLLTAAQKDPKKADWKAVRRAFSETSHYHPYDSSWRDDSVKVIEKMKEGKLKAAETSLVELLARERLMRIDGHALAVSLYEKMGDSEKARKHKDLFDALSSTVFAPGNGTSFENPIEVLFIEEEYTALSTMRLAVKQQALSEQNGHRFDILTTRARAGQPERTFYFNIDMPWKSLEAGMMKAFEKSKKIDEKKK